MAKKDGFKKAIRNRGEDIGEARPLAPYDYQTGKTRAIDRPEVRQTFDEMYRDQQRRDERAMQRLRAIGQEFYAGVDPRRKQEVADAGMIREDHNAMANLPTQARHYEYTKAGYYTTPYIDSLLRGGNFSFFDED